MIKNSVARGKKDDSGPSYPLRGGPIAIEPTTGLDHRKGESLRTSRPIDSWSSSSDPVDPATRTGRIPYERPWPDQDAVLRRFHQQLACAAASDRVRRHARRWIVWVLGLCCLVLVPWTIGLALALPRHYLVGNWPLAWAGFDIILLGCLSTTAWALWKQRQVVVPAAMITSALLLCDAWFDILTAHPGHCLILSIATAMFAELPLAILLGLTSIELLGLNTGIGRRGGLASAASTLA